MLYKELITLPILGGSEVLTTCPLISQLNNVTFIDSPDGNQWVKKGDFVLTTGYFASGTIEWEDRFYEFIEGLIEREGFGIGVKIGRHIPYLPKKIQQYANENGFLILKLDNKPAWADFLWEITQALSKAKDNEIYELNNIYEKFHDHLRNRGNIEQLAHVLYSVIKIPLTIYLKKTNMRIDYPQRPHHTIDLDYLISTAFYGISNEIQTVKYDQKLFTIKWINEKTTLEGGIFIWSDSVEITPKIKIAVEQAALIANMEVENQNMIKSIEQRQLNDFILELINNSFESEYYVKNRMKKFDLKIADAYRVLLIHLEQDDEIFKEKLINKIKFIRKFDLTSILIGQKPDSNFIILIPQKIFESTAAQLMNFITGEHPTLKIKCGVSRAYSLVKLSLAHQEAKTSLMISKKTHVEKDFVISTNFECLSLERIMFSDSIIKEAKQIFEETLEKIINHDNKNNSELLHTLHCYIECNLNIEKTGEKLFLHKNTVRYRLKVIAALLNISFDSINIIILLKIAFTYFHLNREKEDKYIL